MILLDDDDDDMLSDDIVDERCYARARRAQSRAA